MKAISLKQPWASMIASGQKTIETRKWRTAYRGELLIVASKHPKFKDPLGSGWLPTGQALCVVELVDCRPMIKADERLAGCSVYPKAMAWVLRNIRPINPFPLKGQLSLFEVPDVNFCRCCGFRIGHLSDYCGECACEEDSI